MNPADLFRRISVLLEQAGIPYMLTGSFASSVYGMGRGSPDVDFVIGSDEEGVRRLLRQLPEADFSSNLNQALDACRKRSTFNAKDQRSILSITLAVSRLISSSLKIESSAGWSLKRRMKIQVWSVPLYMATPEDVGLATLEWAKLRAFDRQIEDAAGILKVRRDQLDLPYIEKWVRNSASPTSGSRPAGSRTWIRITTDSKMEFLTIICNLPTQKRT
jgi:hypothetical protein